MKGIAIVIVLFSAIVAYVGYLRPTDAQLAFAQTRVSVAQGELATVLGRTVIEPRLRREHAQIAKRLGTLGADSPSQAETAFLIEATRLAHHTGTHITQIVSKGAALPLFQATPVPLRAPPLPLAASDVRGMRLPRTLTVIGSFGGLLRFIDGLGNLQPLVRVNSAALAQTERLRATMDLDIVVLDATQVREAML